MKKTISIHVFVCLIALSFSCNGQGLLRNETLRKDDADPFIMGVSPDTGQNEILIRIDRTVAALIEKSGKSYLQFNASGNSNSSPASWERLNVAVDQRGLLKTDYGPYTVGFDNMSLSRMLLVGSVQLKKREQRKVRWIDLDAGSAIPDLAGFKKLETIYINHDVFNPSLSIERESFFFYYPGDPYFWRSFYQVPKLRSIRVDIAESRPPFSSGWISFPDAPSDSLIDLPELRAIHFEHIDYFSVDFGELEKLDYLKLTGLQWAETVNLALVMHAFGKNKELGSWTRHLEKADTSRLPFILADGRYESFYANHTKLCEGSFRNAKPDSVWRFWSENGKLVQERHYAQGVRTGTWFFRSEASDDIMDTLLILNYENDQLVMRIDYKAGEAFYFNEGYDRQGGTPARQVTRTVIRRHPEMSITRNIDVVNIQDYKACPPRRGDYPKAHYGDTIKGVREEYKQVNGEWTYSTASFCESCADYYRYRYDFKGVNGQQAYFNSATTYSGSPRREKIVTIDLKNCLLRRSEKEVVGSDVKENESEQPIGTEEWNCKEFN